MPDRTDRARDYLVELTDTESWTVGLLLCQVFVPDAVHHSVSLGARTVEATRRDGVSIPTVLAAGRAAWAYHREHPALYGYVKTMASMGFQPPRSDQ
ncbi:hypothetical protein [Nakamurella leprariae]|uniref:Uncharacterized protein n=1 Tax=Nakamurella leprariae TaxID=2803911 RepID=A0A938YDB5_9ACTN|nr:hypothetical protein [Nakamurella leprariae]MBM9466094.1 hypothetical protein [Nakamurella leprariae]